MDEAIDRGSKVVIYPDYIKHKDFNDMVVAGEADLITLVLLKECVHSGIAAKAALSRWKKC
jgi:hypothetical protein